MNQSTMALTLVLCSIASTSSAEEFKPSTGPEKIDWPKGMPKQTQLPDGSWVLPPERAEAVARALLDWKQWPAMCQKSLDAEAQRCNVAITGAVREAVAVDRLDGSFAIHHHATVGDHRENFFGVSKRC